MPNQVIPDDIPLKDFQVIYTIKLNFVIENKSTRYQRSFCYLSLTDAQLAKNILRFCINNLQLFFYFLQFLFSII